MEKRLQSLKLPRDLTLGGTKPKKTFTPNLNVARNKDRGKEHFIKTDDKRKSKNTKESKINRKFNDKSVLRFVQSSGIFSDGMGNDTVKKARFYDRTKDDSPSSTAMAMPKVKKDEWQVDNKNETKVFDDIMGCESPIDDDDDKSPFAPISWNEADLKESKVPISNKPEIKSETDEPIKLDLDRLKIETESVPVEFQETDHFSDYNPALTLWNLPDSFAGKGLSEDPDVQTFFDYKLGEMLEGQIGKMRIHKSGKIEVFIGCVKYQIEPTQLETFSEKIVTIDSNKQGSSGTVLGHVQNRYILNPDWNYLIKDS